MIWEGPEGSLAWGLPRPCLTLRPAVTPWRRMRTCMTVWRMRRPRATRSMRTSCARSRCPCRCVGVKDWAWMGARPKGSPGSPNTGLSSPLSAQDDRLRQAVLLPARDPADGGEVHGHAGLHPTGAMPPPHPAPARRMPGSGRQVRPPALHLWATPCFLCLSSSLVFRGSHPVLFLSPSASFPLRIPISVSVIIFDFFPLFPVAIAF